MPRFEHIVADQHLEVLHNAISQANDVLILICPWIKIRVFVSHLAAIDNALQRGCRIWIGHGMPENHKYQNQESDLEAIAALRSRESGGLLRLIRLITHEKVIIQDDQLWVNTSCNFLSHTGGDGRRESGIILRGGVAEHRDRFLREISAKAASNIRNGQPTYRLKNAVKNANVGTGIELRDG